MTLFVVVTKATQDSFHGNRTKQLHRDEAARRRFLDALALEVPEASLSRIRDSAFLSLHVCVVHSMFLVRTLSSALKIPSYFETSHPENVSAQIVLVRFLLVRVSRSVSQHPAELSHSLIGAWLSSSCARTIFVSLAVEITTCSTGHTRQ